VATRIDLGQLLLNVGRALTAGPGQLSQRPLAGPTALLDFAVVAAHAASRCHAQRSTNSRDPIAAFERVALRPDLHAPPEIGFEEQRTASIVG